MGFIPVDKSGKQQYEYDTRSFRVKLLMLFWEHVGIPMLGRTVKGKVYEYEHIHGERMKFVNCTFKRCKFDGLKLVFILNSTLEHETPILNFSNMSMSAIRNCVFYKVKKIMEGDGR